MENELSELGLSKTEAKIYLYLVENGVSSPPQIARGTKTALPNVYPVLQSLRERALLTEQKKKARRTYVANDPASLVAIAAKRKMAAEKLVPDLRALYTTQKNKPRVKFYDGWEQVKEIYLQSLEAEELWAMGSIEDIDRVDHAFFVHFQKEVKRKQQFIYDLLPFSAKDKAAKEAVERIGIFYKAAFLPKKYDRLPIDIMVWGNNVALISLEEPIIGTVITGGYFAQVFKILLEVARPPETRTT